MCWKMNLCSSFLRLYVVLVACTYTHVKAQNGKMCKYTTALIFVYTSVLVHCSSVFMFIGFSVTWKIVTFGYRY